VKPHSQDEASGRLKVNDFGTSRRLTDNLNRTFRHAGAWAYQAPEIQLANQRGAVSDLFSVGAVLYHAVAGRLPRQHSGPAHDGSHHPPKAVQPGDPPELDDLITELLVDDPARGICLRRLADYETLTGDLSRAEHSRQERLTATRSPPQVAVALPCRMSPAAKTSGKQVGRPAK
jgi:serine/threonine protein kinase